VPDAVTFGLVIGLSERAFRQGAGQRREYRKFHLFDFSVDAERVGILLHQP
jgi:hypothetical protein